MIIYTNTPKSKKRKPNAKKRALASSWQEILNKHKVGYSYTKKPAFTVYVPPKPRWVEPGRDSKAYPSVNTEYHDTSKKTPLFYTGDKMKGIGTLHKSNAVPIFTDEEAKDQANMRR